MFGFGGYFGHTLGEVHRDLGVVIKIDSSEHQVSSDTVQIVRSRTIVIDSSLHICSSTEVITLYAPRWREDPNATSEWDSNQSVPQQWNDPAGKALSPWETQQDPQSQQWSEDNNKQPAHWQQ